MDKVTVTKEQMEVVNIIKVGISLEKALVIKLDKKDRFISKYKSLNSMTAEQIALAWYGHAEVELEYVSFDEAMKAHDDGSLVSFHREEGSKITESLLNRLKDGWLGGYSLKQLREGKWSIEGENNG